MPRTTSVKERPLRDVVADALRADITRGVLLPGSRVREEQLALDHGVSRVPVREALQRLAGEGFLVLSPHRGATVATPSPVKALELMEIRRWLELLAVCRAAELRGGAVADRLRRVVRDGRTSLERGEHTALPRLIDDFHALIAEASGSSELVAMLDGLRARVAWMFAVDLESRSDKSWHDHEEILEAVLGGRVTAAAELMDRHVLRDERLFLQRARGQT